MREESQPFVVESLLGDIRRNAHNYLLRLGAKIRADSFPPKSVERFRKNASNSYVAR
jgi:hypothetical protein